MDDLSDYVLEVAFRRSVDIGWRRVDPIVKAAREAQDPYGYVEAEIARLAVELERAAA